MLSLATMWAIHIHKLRDLKKKVAQLMDYVAKLQENMCLQIQAGGG